ncbi:hypothetical protein Y032_0001g337 [Ancylostoma ceylanicum]|uniref:Uncharacterized protein n=1 Tax=Ancylostoma ceylanicum TaxID=53326 RepID=A0A016W4Q0_9BILA|nr:hypothetical protein Y032_0001g337 [Ancylostoma ceylanicum]
MMVAQLTLLLVAFVMSDASFQDILKVYDHCYADAEALNSLTGNATPTLIQLPEWCMAMRHDVAPCLAEAVGLPSRILGFGVQQKSMGASTPTTAVRAEQQ